MDVFHIIIGTFEKEDTKLSYHNKYQQKLSRIFIGAVLGAVLLVGIKHSLDQSNIRNIVLESIRAGIAPEALIEFKFTEEEASELNWLKDHEFEIAGEMYDVVSTEFVNSNIIYKCFHDTKETKYKRRFYKLLGRWVLPNDKGQDPKQKNQKSFKTYYFQVNTNTLTFGLAQASSNRYFLFLDKDSRLTTGPNSPPPRF